MMIMMMMVMMMMITMMMMMITMICNRDSNGTVLAKLVTRAIVVI